MSTINLDDNAPIDDTLYGRNYQDDYKYMQHKIIAQNEGFNEIEGVNAMVYDGKHDFLKDLQTQQKKKTYPSMFTTSYEFG